VKLTLLQLAEDVARNGSECDSTAEDLARRVCALLETPWPCGWPEPVNAGITWESLGPLTTLTPDEALALAAGLIRTALEAKEQPK
jgi:hypothetical protein